MNGLHPTDESEPTDIQLWCFVGAINGSKNHLLLKIKAIKGIVKGNPAETFNIQNVSHEAIKKKKNDPFTDQQTNKKKKKLKVPNT